MIGRIKAMRLSMVRPDFLRRLPATRRQTTRDRITRG